VISAFCLCRGCFLYSDEVETQDTKFPDGAPWFTGPLLSPSSATAKPGRVNIFPYLNTNITYGKYNKHWKIEGAPQAHKEEKLCA